MNWELIGGIANILSIIAIVVGIVIYYIRKENNKKLDTFSKIFDSFIKANESEEKLLDFEDLYINPRKFANTFSEYVEKWKKEYQLTIIMEENGKDIDENFEEYSRLLQETNEESDNVEQSEEILSYCQSSTNEYDEEARERYREYIKLTNREKEEYLQKFIENGLNDHIAIPKEREFRNLIKYVEKVHIELTKNGYQYNRYFDECMEILNKLYLNLSSTDENGILCGYECVKYLMLKKIKQDINNKKSIYSGTVYAGMANKNELLSCGEMYRTLVELNKFIQKYSFKANRLMYSRLLIT
ncbi:MAG: hypothetical protein Q4B83_00830 [Ligilactobacillus murinus]|nr:hypothetical protein [Ligilactobacillus murinus]